jgi:hypothetical protein
MLYSHFMLSLESKTFRNLFAFIFIKYFRVLYLYFHLFFNLLDRHARPIGSMSIPII